jgi:hypothetical protein
VANANATNSRARSGLKTRTNLKAGKYNPKPPRSNHNQTLAKETGIKVRTNLKAGGNCQGAGVKH